MDISNCLILVFTLVLLWITKIKGEIRCYCNKAECVSTGYMCKSPSGRCFSLLTYEAGSSGTEPIHGCGEQLPLPDRTVCNESGDIVRTYQGRTKWPLLMCCIDDMCNYMAQLDPSTVHVTNGSDTLGSGVKRNAKEGLEEALNQRDLWFKAAVIAVPIAGGFILILLVLLAIRMLRNDSRRQRHLIQIRRHRSLTKAQLYVADHFCDKYDRHAQFSHLEKPYHHMYRDVNIKIDADGHKYEKISDVSSAHDGSCNSVILYKDAKAGSATVV